MIMIIIVNWIQVPIILVCSVSGLNVQLNNI